MGGVPLANYTISRRMEVEGCFMEPRSVESTTRSIVNTLEGGSGKTYRVYVTASNIGAQVSTPSEYVDIRLPVPSTTIYVKNGQSIANGLNKTISYGQHVIIEAGTYIVNETIIMAVDQIVLLSLNGSTMTTVALKRNRFLWANPLEKKYAFSRVEGLTFVNGEANENGDSLHGGVFPIFEYTALCNFSRCTVFKQWRSQRRMRWCIKFCLKFRAISIEPYRFQK